MRQLLFGPYATHPTLSALLPLLCVQQTKELDWLWLSLSFPFSVSLLKHQDLHLLLSSLVVLRRRATIFQMGLLGWHFPRRLVSLLAAAVAVEMAVVVQKMTPSQVVVAFVADTLARQVVGSLLHVAGL